MKRSERIRKDAAWTALMGLTVLCAGFCVAAWAASAWLTTASGGALTGLLALAGLALAVHLLRDAWRLRLLARREALYEWEREVRPRL